MVGGSSDKNGLTLQNASACRTTPSRRAAEPPSRRAAEPPSRRAAEAMTAPRPRDRRRPPSPPDRPPPRAGAAAPLLYIFAICAASAAACFSLLGALALPAAAQTDVTVSFGAASYDAYEGDPGKPATVGVHLSPLTPLATAPWCR